MGAATCWVVVATPGERVSLFESETQGMRVTFCRIQALRSNTGAIRLYAKGSAYHGADLERLDSVPLQTDRKLIDLREWEIDADIAGDGVSLIHNGPC